MVFATSIFPSGTDTDMIAAITGAISDNIAIVLAILGFTVGLTYVFRLFRKSLKGKV